MDILHGSIFDLHDRLKKRETSCLEIMGEFLRRAKEKECLNAFITLREEEAEREAKILDKNISKQNDFHPLYGIPYGVKDVICTAGIRSTGGAKILDNYIPSYSATVIEKIQKKGGIILGKQNCDAFGHGASNENSSYGPVKNPWNESLVPGGSSGGSAAALSSGMCAYSIAEDTGGSIRQPAGFCSVTGLKVSYGRNSRYGIMPMASSLDTVGPMARSVEEVALLLEVMAGKDEKDSTTFDLPVPEYTRAIKQKLPRYTVGIPREYFSEGLDERARRVLDEARKAFESLGVIFKQVSLPMTRYAVAAYYIIVPSEDSANLARLDGVRYGKREEAEELFLMYTKTRAKGFPDEVKRRIMIGTYALSAGYYDAYYKKAQKVRTLIVEDFRRVFEEVDMLFTPVSPTLPFAIKEKASDPLAMYMADVYTVPASVAGLTGLSLPAGFAEGLPVGAQIIGPQGAEDKVLHLGYHFQQITDWHKQRPA